MERETLTRQAQERRRLGMRLQMNSFYIFPTDVFFDAAYGFDKFSDKVNSTIVTYGHEWRFFQAGSCSGLIFKINYSCYEN